MGEGLSNFTLRGARLAVFQALGTTMKTVICLPRLSLAQPDVSHVRPGKPNDFHHGESGTRVSCQFWN